MYLPREQWRSNYSSVSKQASVANPSSRATWKMRRQTAFRKYCACHEVSKTQHNVKRKTQWSGWKQTWPSAFHNKITRTMPYPTNHLACHDFVHLHKVKFTKYCTCHQKIDWWIECHWKCDEFIARMTPNTQAVKVQELKLLEFCKTASKHASSRFERKICQMLPPKEGQFDPAHDPSMIGAYKRQTASRLFAEIKNLTVENHFVWKNRLRLTPKVSPNTAPANKKWQFSKITNSARLPQNWQLKNQLLLFLASLTLSNSYSQLLVLSASLPSATFTLSHSTLRYS